MLQNLLSVVSEIGDWVWVLRPLVWLVSKWRQHLAKRGTVLLVVILIPADGPRA